MKRRFFSCLLVAVMLLSILALPAGAEETTGSGTAAQSQGSTGTTGGESGGTTGGTTGGESGGESGGGSGGETGGTTGGTGGNGGSTGGSGSTGTECTHAWVYVEIPATCTEYGAKGYGCGLCGATANVEALPLAPHTYDHGCDADCNVCGATREIKHKFSPVWDYNGTQHWHICTICKTEKADLGGHYPGPAATEDKDQICLTCGKIMTRKLEHKHEWVAEWSFDASGHFHKCKDEECLETDAAVAHVYDDACDSDCNICGYVTETAHSFDGDWMTDASGHWSVCTVCGHTSEPAVHVSVEEATDTKAQLCAVCGYEMAPALLHNHEAGESWSYDNDLHWKACECGEKLEEAPHTWGEETKGEDGAVVQRCAGCGAEKRTEASARKSGGSIGLTILLVVLVVALVGAVVALIFVLRLQKKNTNSGKFGR